jgi:hypothetical protein
LKRLYISIILHDVTLQKTPIFTVTSLVVEHIRVSTAHACARFVGYGSGVAENSGPVTRHIPQVLNPLTTALTRRKYLLDNQTDALIQIYFVIKLYMFRAISLPIIRSFILYIRHWYISCRTERPESARKRSSNLHEIYQCRMYSRKLLMMGREIARNM